MKICFKRISVILAICLALNSCSGDRNTDSTRNNEVSSERDAPNDHNQSVKIIRELISRIESDTPNYSVRTLENEQFMDHGTDGGGSLTDYFKSGELRKIVSHVGLSSCYTVTSYYLEKKSLVAVVGSEMDYNYDHATTTIDYNSVFKAYDFTFYFENDLLVGSDFEGRPRCSKKLSNADAISFLEECKSYVFLFSGN